LNLILSPEADKDLEEAALYLGRHAPKTSLRFARAVERTLSMIAALPELAPLISSPAGRLKGMRKFGVRGFRQYLIFYRIRADVIDIVRVLHAARDVTRIIGGE